jgi:hypothetical protein
MSEKSQRDLYDDMMVHPENYLHGLPETEKNLSSISQAGLFALYELELMKEYGLKYGDGNFTSSEA